MNPIKNIVLIVAMAMEAKPIINTMQMQPTNIFEGLPRIVHEINRATWRTDCR